MGKPETFQKPLEGFRKACAEVGRAPESIGVTTLITLAFPDLMPKGQSEPEALTGTAEEIAEAMRGYEQMGVAHLMFHLVPYHPKALDRLAQALAFYRQ